MQQQHSSSIDTTTALYRPGIHSYIQTLNPGWSLPLPSPSLSCFYPHPLQSVGLQMDFFSFFVSTPVLRKDDIYVFILGTENAMGEARVLRWVCNLVFTSDKSIPSTQYGSKPYMHSVHHHLPIVEWTFPTWHRLVVAKWSCSLYDELHVEVNPEKLRSLLLREI